MFKQPIENTNATPADEQRSSERLNRAANPAQDHAEIEAEARRLAQERGHSESYTAEDWNHAEQIVRNRKISLSKA